MLIPTCNNQILEETVLSKLTAEKREACDHKLCDFDTVTFGVAISPKDKNTMKIYMNVDFWSEVAEHGCSEAAQQFYSPYVVDSSSDKNCVELVVNLDDFHEDPEEFAKRVGNMKANVLGAVFRRYFDALRTDKLSSNAQQYPPLTVHLRPDTTMFLCPSKDRLVAIFGMEFPNKTDRVIASVILGEFQEARRKYGSAPICNFGFKTPIELASMNVKSTPECGWLSLAILKNHVKTESKVAEAALYMITLRHFITYHIKCSKAFFHQRMRAQVSDFLQILNRAKTQKEKTKKLYSGKTFKQ